MESPMLQKQGLQCFNSIKGTIKTPLLQNQTEYYNVSIP